MSELKEGEVKSFREDKGYGFIRNGGKKDIFFHAREWQACEDRILRPFRDGEEKRCPRKGNKVLFSLEQNSSTPRAAAWGLLN